MAQQRKKRILVYEIRVTLFTDFLQKMVEDTIDNLVSGMRNYSISKGRITKWEVTKRVLDGKTFAEIKK